MPPNYAASATSAIYLFLPAVFIGNCFRYLQPSFQYHLRGDHFSYSYAILSPHFVLHPFQETIYCSIEILTWVISGAE